MFFKRSHNRDRLPAKATRAALIVFCLVFATGQGARAQAQETARKTDRAPAPIRLTGFNVVGTEDRVRLVFDTSGAVEAKILLLSAPYRLVVDLPGAEIDLKTDRSSGSPGFLKKVSYGTTDANVPRFVIEAAVPLILEKQFSVPADRGEGNRLVFDLAKASETDFRIAIVRQAEERRIETLALDDSPKNKDPETSGAAAAKGDLGSAARQAEAASSSRKKRIVIDPGHGGKDGGARSLNGVLEKDVVLSFSKELAHALTASGAFEVTLTRTDDRFVRLGERVRIAREIEADLFVSIHADSLPDDRRVRGAAVYTISERASDAMAASIADQQNKSDAIAGPAIVNAPDSVVDILFDLTRRETSNLSILFARHFFDTMKTRIRFFKDPLQRGAFIVLRVPDIPSALIELGFLSNPEDAELLSSEKWREEAALQMASTIAAYFEAPLANLNQ